MIVYSAIIIGAGPAGIATANELINKGLPREKILILEKSEQISNMVQMKYPDEKPVLSNYKGQIAECIGELCITDMSKQEFQAYLENVVRDKGISINFDQNVQKIIKLSNRQWNVCTPSITYLSNSIFIAIGNMSAPRELDAIIDSSARHYIHSDIQKITPNEKRVLVVGGGDSASEYAQILATRGHEVTLSYRKESLNNMHPQNQEKLHFLIKTMKVRYLPGSQVKSVTCSGDLVQVLFENTVPLEVEAVVTALGNERPTAYLENIGISLKTEIGEKYLEDEKGGLFYIGDLAAGIRGGSINLAFDSASEAVSQACSFYLDCKR